jgi:succinate dehydrogenase flavin-adding protein (antitoxin of CptAB toxin-antitoxin module)
MSHQKYNKLSLPFTDVERNNFSDKYNLYPNDEDSRQVIQQNIIKNGQYIPLNSCKYLYRAISDKEMFALIADEKIINKKMLGFSFSKNLLNVQNYINTKLSYIVTYDAEIMRNNFKFIDIIPSVNWLKENIEIAENIVNDYTGILLRYISKIYDITVDSTTEALQKLLDLEDKQTINTLFTLIVREQECLLTGEYWFVRGMITNIQVQNGKENHLEDLYNFILENQEKLNLYI